MKRFAKTVSAVLLLSLLLGACGGAEAPGTPTPDLNAAATSVAQTVVAGFTQTVLAMPTATDTAAPSETATISPTPGTPGASILPIGTAPTVTLGTPGAFPSLTALPSPFFTPIGGYCDEMTFLGDITIPDGSVVERGSGFTKTWAVKNTGTCDWTEEYKLIVAAGNWLNYIPVQHLRELTGKRVVPVGGDAWISVDLAAPHEDGAYETYFQLVNENVGAPFGSLLVSIRVVKEPPTATPKPKKKG